MDNHPRRRQRRRRRPRQGFLITLCVALALVLAVLIAVTAYIDHTFGLINKVDPGTQATISSEDMETIFNTETIDPTFDGTTIDPSDVTWDTIPTEPIIDHPDIINILLIGQDGRAYDERGRSDSMILCTFNTITNTVTMSSFLRDLYVQIPGQEDNRINAAYSLGGMSLLKETLELNFGVHIDACVEVSFYGFPQIVDKLGGIDLELTQAEADYLNRRGNWGVWGGTGENVWTLTAGVNHMNGEQALAYSRIRDIGDDFGRSERQRKVLSILMEQCKSLSLTSAMDLLNTFLPLITTDMSNQQITSYAMAMFPMLTNLNTVSQRIPTWGTYSNAVIRGMQVLLPDLPKIRQQLIDTGAITPIENN